MENTLLRRALATIVVFVIACAPVANALNHVEQVPTTSGNVVAGEPAWPSFEVADATEQEFLALMARPEAPPMEYWLRLAHCETRIDYANEGSWGGAFGFYTRGKFAESSMGGWERFGGEQFAGHPMHATPVEQFVVAMRTGFGGWYGTVVDRGADVAQRKGVPRFYVWDRSPFGYWTWGCAKRKVGDPCGYLYDGTVLAIEHAKPAYCEHLKPIDYTKVDGSMRYQHNANIAKASAKVGNATSVAMPGALAWVAADRIGMVTTVTAPETAKCPAYWQAALDAGFAVADLPTVDAIMWEQSQCQPRKHDKPGDRLGLMQVHGDQTSWLRLNIVLESTIDLFDPATNLRAAYLITRRDERKHGNPWLAWP